MARGPTNGTALGPAAEAAAEVAFDFRSKFSMIVTGVLSLRGC